MVPCVYHFIIKILYGISINGSFVNTHNRKIYGSMDKTYSAPVISSSALFKIYIENQINYIKILAIYKHCRESFTSIKVKWHCNEILLFSEIIFKKERKRKKTVTKYKNGTYSLKKHYCLRCIRH